MSFKTLRKRIALVAVAALAVTGLSTVPANAGQVSTGAITLTKVTTSPAVNSAVLVSVKIGVAALTANGDAFTVKAYIKSKPSGAAGLLTVDQTADGTTDDDSDFGADDAVGSGIQDMTLTDDNEVLVDGDKKLSAGTYTLGNLSFTPAKAGDYVIYAWNDKSADDVVDIGEEFQEITVTVAAGTASAGYSTQAGFVAGTASRVAGTDADTASVTVKNEANADLFGQLVRAVVSGPGTLTLTDPDGATATGRDVSALLDSDENTFDVLLEADGTAGVSTVSIYSGGVLIEVLPEIVFYADLAKLTVTQNVKHIVADDATGDLNGDATSVYAVTVSGSDANGNLYPLTAATLVGLSSDGTILTDYAAADAESLYGADVANTEYGILVNTPASATSGKSATMTFSYTFTNELGLPTKISASPITFIIGGAAKTVTMALDKATYTPGELATLTVTVKDSAGNPSADGISGFSSLPASNVNAPEAAGNVWETAAGTYKVKLYAPTVSGDWIITGKDASAAKNAVTASAKVSATSSEAAISALVAAIAKLQAAIKKINKRLKR